MGTTTRQSTFSHKTVLAVAAILTFLVATCCVLATAQPAHAAKAVKIKTTYVACNSGSNSWATGNYSNKDRYIIKGVDKKGDVVWKMRTAKFYSRLGKSIGIRSHEKCFYVYTAGKLAKYKVSNGKRLWVKSHLGKAADSFSFKCLRVDKRGNAYIVNKGGTVMKFTAKGKLAWRTKTSVDYMAELKLNKANPSKVTVKAPSLAVRDTYVLSAKTGKVLKIIRNG